MLLQQYERTVEQATARVHRLRGDLVGAASEAERVHLEARSALFEKLAEETQARAHQVRRTLSDAAG